MEGAEAQMRRIRANSSHLDGPKDPTHRVGAWAGATPVWAPLARPAPPAGSRQPGVAPAHAVSLLAG
jgi:hypothetical protein